MSRLPRIIVPLVAVLLAASALSLVLPGVGAQRAAPGAGPRYVRWDASGADDGSSWADAYTGLIAQSSLASVRADICVMSATAVDLDHHYHPSQAMPQVKRAMLASSRFCILAIDSSKLERSGLYKVGDLTDFDVIVADARLPKEYTDALIDAGHTVIRA